ncbi:Ig-like domain repeat protein [Methanosphaera sp. ISO3-F5]|uniref:Ig-like domain repeat protein n=1 Tax=Methanosphaera sp. ISO3-F5 TaxID=1452353 RepID=UPI002B262A70|nr:Ig-like domain repeat protein [Methanosphaera sp. ISO3-F5]WQH64347.1 Ig-like domain repeat protein [Methanosphaera sp. ISO3-F5]
MKSKMKYFIVLITLLFLTISVASASDNTTTHTNTDTLEQTTHTVEKVATSTEAKKIEKQNNNHNKSLKTEGQTKDYYVSDTSGLDTNTGTQESPFKTIQTAIDKTGSDATYNIHIAEGTYKGLKNTNLTVNGNNKINFIGAGINKTVIDGEAKYDIDITQFHWDSSDIWAPYVNDSGNWFMNITTGKGNIKISNFTVQNAWAPGVDGGDSIRKYPIANIDNYGNLTIDNIYFYRNHGGVGSAVRNNANSTLLVNNSVFEGCRKSSSTGNDGIIYNKGTSIIFNSLFDSNYARWGTILNDNNLTVINCTLQNGIGYDGQSAYLYGTGIAANSGEADYYLRYNVNTSTQVFNCTFINNDQSDINIKSGNLTLVGSKFINSTGVLLTDLTDGDYSFNITGNTFLDAKPIITNLVTSESISWRSIESKVKNHNMYISNNKIHNCLSSLKFNNAIIRGNEFDICISGSNLTVENNYIVTNDSFTVYARENSTVTNNYLVARDTFGDASAGSSTNVRDNLPKEPEKPIYIKSTVRTPRSGTLDDPTTIFDALTKVEENGTIILLQGSYSYGTININPDTLKSDVKTFSITGFTFNPTMNGLNRNCVFNISEGYNININNINFINGKGVNGGFISTASNLSVIDCTFTNSIADKGGAIYITGTGNINLINNNFINIQSSDETLYLNNTGNKNLKNNQYTNCSIKTNTIKINRENTEQINVNDTCNIQINQITLTNPTYYDSNILENINYLIYENDVNTKSTTENKYSINTEIPIEVTTKIRPEFLNEYSNEITVDVRYDTPRAITMNTNDILALGNDEITTTLIDEFGLPVTDATVSYYINNELIATVNVENSQATFTLPNKALGEYTLTTTFNDTNNKYINQTKNNLLVISDKIFVSPTVTSADFGTMDKPTTITNALNIIKNDKTILLLPGKYLLDNQIIINQTSTPNANKFIISGENAILDGQNKGYILDIAQGYDILIEKVTFTRGKGSYRVSPTSPNIITVNGKLTLNHTTIQNINSVDGYDIQNYGELVIDENNTFKNIRSSRLIGGNVKINNNNIFENINCVLSIIYSNNGFINNSQFINCHFNATSSNGLIEGTNITILNNSFIGCSATSKGAAIGIINNGTVINNTFINNTSPTETIYVINPDLVTIKNNTYINTTIGINIPTISLEPYTSPIKLGDTLTVNVGEITLKNPTFYDSDLLDKMEIYGYINDEKDIQITKNTPQYTTTLKVADEVTIYVKTSESNIISNKIELDVQNGELLNVLIKTEPINAINGESTSFNIQVTDKENNPVSDGGIVTLYDENNNIIAQNTTKNGITTLNTNILKHIGQKDFKITYNTTATYNNKTSTVSITTTSREVYVSPDIFEAQEGTIDNPTTIEDAISKVANNGVIYLLHGSDGIYYAINQIDINDLTTKASVNTFNITSYTGTVTFDASNVPHLFTIAQGYDITLNNVSIKNSKNTAICNNGTLTLNGEAKYENNIEQGDRNNYGFINNQNATLYIIGKNEFINNRGTTAVIYSYKPSTIIINGENKFINNTSLNAGGVIYLQSGGTLIINGCNIFENNKIDNNGRAGGTGGAIAFTGQSGIMNTIIINGSNIFENNSVHGNSRCYGGALGIRANSVDINVLINGSNIFSQNKIDPGTYDITGGAIYALMNKGNLTINGTNIFDSNKAYGYGGAIYFQGLNLNITGNNQFINNENINKTTILDPITNRGIITIIPQAQSVINIDGTIFQNNTADLQGPINFVISNPNVKINIENNTIKENNGNISILYFTANNINGLEVNITNNTFQDNTAEEETIYFTQEFTRNIQDNKYINTPIGIQELTISSELENKEVQVKVMIPLNITAGLVNPTFYDENILDKLNYEVYVNNQNTINKTTNNFNIEAKYFEETQGKEEINIKYYNQTSNTIIINIKRIASNITVTSPSENTVNKTTPITIMLFDEEGNLIRNTTINMTINNKTEEVTLVNGAIVYDFTPETVGNTTIKFTFAGNDTLNPTETETTINVVADKDKIIEDLNKNLTETTEKLENTTQKAETLEKQLKDANQTINNQKTTLDNLNKTLTQTQKDLQNANKKITEQNQTINNLEKQLTDANNKINNLNKSNNDLNNKLNDANKKVDNLTNANNNLNKQLADANKKIDTLTKQNADLEKQLADLKQKVDALTKTVDTLNKTVAARDNTIKELTTKVATKITVSKINTTTYAGKVTVTGKVTDKNGKALNNMPVSIKINTGTTKAVTNANGVYTYTTSAWSVGTSNVTVSAIANDKYTTSSAKTTFKVSKAKPVLKLNSISAVKYKDKVTVTGSLMDNNNKAISGAQITLKINSKSVTVKTGKDGSFTYTTSATSMGTNNITATYNGNTKYNKVTGKTTFKVNKQNLILTVDRVASGLKFKDPLVVGGRLVDGNGKAVANTQVSLKFNGKTYKAKTDKNGYYKVTTRATTMDKNNLTVTYAGNKYYNKATAKTTFTVAKQDIVITFNTVKYSNGKVTISGTFTDRNRHALMNSLARITLNGKQGTAKTDKTGTFTYTSKASKGTYKVTLAYPGNARYNAYSKTSTVKTA